MLNTVRAKNTSMHNNVSALTLDTYLNTIEKGIRKREREIEGGGERRMRERERERGRERERERERERR